MFFEYRKTLSSTQIYKEEDKRKIIGYLRALDRVFYEDKPKKKIKGPPITEDTKKFSKQRQQDFLDAMKTRKLPLLDYTRQRKQL